LVSVHLVMSRDDEIVDSMDEVTSVVTSEVTSGATEVVAAVEEMRGQRKLKRELRMATVAVGGRSSVARKLTPPEPNAGYLLPQLHHA
jgi:hypothetical protein